MNIANRFAQIVGPLIHDVCWITVGAGVATCLVVLGLLWIMEK